MTEKRATLLHVDEDPAALQNYFEREGWTDGLPILPPTPALVEEMVRASGMAPEAAVAPVAPSFATASVEKVAINAVMAGCRPDYMPVVLAAVRAIAEPEFNLAGVQATTHPVAPLVMVNGPIRQRIGLNCAGNVLGQGFRANATIGRALRLVMMNIGQGIPGKSDMATHGTPCKFSYCGGENEERSPWAPYHVEHGMHPDESSVLVHAAEAPHNVNDHASRNADELLLMIAEVMMSVGANNLSSGGEMLVVIGPEHAALLARDGLGKDDVRRELHRRTRIALERISAGNREWYKTKRTTFNVAPDATHIPYLDDPSQIRIMVSGGQGLHSLVIPSFGISRCILRRID